VKIINMTPHDVYVYGPTRKNTDDPIFVYPKSGKVARVSAIPIGVGRMTAVELELQQIPEDIMYELVRYGQLEGLPSPKPAVSYIVSLVAALAARDRNDLLAPYDEVRNEQGTVIGCRYLQMIY
jgi:hypothetical protein